MIINQYVPRSSQPQIKMLRGGDVSVASSEKLKTQNGTGMVCQKLQSAAILPTSEEHLSKVSSNGQFKDRSKPPIWCPCCRNINPAESTMCLRCQTRLLSDRNIPDMPPGPQITSNKKKDGTTSLDAALKGDIPYLIIDACEDMDPAYEDYDQQICCPRCGAACPSTYEEERKIICKCKWCFCAGCDREYKQDCPTKVECKRGPHCHHPRNCIYYLRNLSVRSLERLLKENKIRYESYISWVCEEERKGRRVRTMHSDHGFKEIFCKPYQEYLIGIIKLYKLDPADVMAETELESVITRECLTFPNDRSLQGLRDFLKSELPIR